MLKGSTTTDTMEAKTLNTAKSHNFALRLSQKFEGDYVFSYEIGRKYARIIQSPVLGSGRSVYCFIRLDDGAIFKAASWKTPAKGVRAWLDQILASNLDGVDPYTSWLYRRG